MNMHLKKSTIKLIPSPNFVKSNKKYVPTPQQATIIINYFLHNNFQDFNTWQQISKSKCQFQYNETKTQNFQCKVTLKWDDNSLPVIVQVGKSRNKKNAKKKALHKLIENLIFLGYIGYGFKDSDFIKKLPKRRKQSSDDDSLIQSYYCDKNIFPFLLTHQFQQALQYVNCKNFEKLLSCAIKKRDLMMVVKILRKMQNNQASVSDFDVRYNPSDTQEVKWQNYQQTQLRDLYKDDLADILRFYQQFQLPSKCSNSNVKQEHQIINLELPCQSLHSSQGKISFQFFHPIEYNLIFRRNIQKSESPAEKRDKSEYFKDFYNQIPLPFFESQNQLTPLTYKVIQRILSLFLEFSYDYNLVMNLLSIFQRQVTSCSFDSSVQQENQQFYLRQILLITAQFAFLVSKKVKITSNFIQGLINYESDGFLTFTPKEPEEILAQKISKKINTNEIQEMLQFANEEIVLLVNKIDPQIIYTAQVLQCWPSIRLRSATFDYENDSQKLPYTMFKLANSKLYNRLMKSIGHIIKIKSKQLKNNTYLFFQRPTQPLLSVIYEMIAEWTSLNETVLLVSENYNEIFMRLMEKGFKVAKIAPKIEEKNIIKKQIICCNPSSVCADALKNYAFTRVIIQGAHKVSQALSTLALDKGLKKLYLIGDPKLPKALVLCKFAKNRNLNQSLFQTLINQKEKIYSFSQFTQQNFFDGSILQILNRNYYNGQLNKLCTIQSPYIKGFPWPSETQRIAFINIHKNQKDRAIGKSVRLCCEIVANIIQAGYIPLNQIGCRVTTTNVRAVLTSHLYNMFRKYPELGVNSQLSSKCVDFISGSRFKQKSLCILIAESNQLHLDHFIAALQESRRGLIVIGDFNCVKHEPEWYSILKYAFQRRIIMQANLD